MTRTLVMTGTNDGLKDVHEITVHGKRKWAADNGYDFLDIRKFGNDALVPIYWLKFLRVVEMSRLYDRTIWLDADSVITNPRKTIDDFIVNDRASLFVSQDWGPGSTFSTGNFVLVPRGESTHELISATYDLGRMKWMHQLFYEQSAMQEILASTPELRYTVRILPGSVLNAVPTFVHPASQNPWTPDCFLAHLTGLYNPRRLEILKNELRTYVP